MWYQPFGRLGARAACASVEFLWDPPFVRRPWERAACQKAKPTPVLKLAS